MIRTLLIDDEYTVVEGLKKLIKWEELGFELVGSAVNGIEGIQKVQKLRPDLVIADIRMPGLDGLAMIEQLKREHIDILFVIMSGYSDFEYAKRALKLGVVDYLEKPVTIQKVTEMLERVKIFYDKNCKEKENETRSQSLSEMTLEKSLLECIYSENQMQELKLMHGLEKYESWCAFKGEFNSYQKGYEKNLEERIRQIITPLALELIMVRSGENFIGVIAGKKREEQKAKWYHVFERIFEDNYKRGETLYMGVGEIYHSLDKLRQSYIEAKSALGYAKFGSIEQVVFYDQLMKYIPVIGLGEFDENVLIRNLRVNNRTGVLEQIREYLNILKRGKVDLRLFEQECLRLVYMANAIVLEKNKSFKITSAYEMLPHEVLHVCIDYMQVEEWACKVFEQILVAISHFKEDEGHKTFNKAKDYIYQNYTRDISLNEVAEKVGMNAAYFSQLFKEKMGISYVKYITNLRLDYAQRLLDEGYKVVQVSEKVGYVNYRYFCDMFKKNTGITPSQYRQNKGI